MKEQTRKHYESLGQIIGFSILALIMGFLYMGQYVLKNMDKDSSFMEDISTNKRQKQ